MIKSANELVPRENRFLHSKLSRWIKCKNGEGKYHNLQNALFGM